MSENIRVLGQGEELPPGAIQIHFGSYGNILLGRGPLEKESLSLTIFERMELEFEHWTDPKYSDNPEQKDLAAQIVMNAGHELDAAVLAFKKNHPVECGYSVPLEDCVASGQHLTSCDNDGYCDFCGHQPGDEP